MSLGTEQFTKEYAQHIDEIYRYVYFAVRQHSPTAEDITSDIFLKAWKHAKRFNPNKASFRTFIFRIARTAVIDYWRTHKQNDPLESVAEYVPHESGARGQQLHIQQQTDATLFWQQAQQQLEQDAYELLVLKYRNELSVAEIALITERSEDAVKSSLKRTRATLKALLTNPSL